MSATDWIIDLVLIGLVLVQVRGRRLSAVQILLPVAIVAWAAVTYVHSIPTTGNSLVLVGAATLLGAAIGAGVGGTTRLRPEEGQVVAQAGPTAAGLWVLGMGSRLVFQLFALHGGGAAIGRFDLDHGIDAGAWAPALIFMAGATVLVRSAVLLHRAAALRGAKGDGAKTSRAGRVTGRARP